MASKRKRIVLTLEQKLEIINRIESGHSYSKIAVDFGIGISTISDIKKSKPKLDQFASQLHINAPGTSGTKRDGIKHLKTMRMAQDEALDKALFMWFSQERLKNIPLSGPMIIAKATSLDRQLNGENSNFHASNGWLHRFKERHCIRQLSIQGEKLSADSESVTIFKERLMTLIEAQKFSGDEIYNADETGLYWKTLPNKTLVCSDEKSAPGGKVCKERITILTCANQRGDHRLPLFVIGKSLKPRCFKNIDISKLPVLYKAQKSCWMTAELFSTWFKTVFIPEVKKQQLLNGIKTPRALLLLDNAPTHPSDMLTEDNNFTVLFLPPNTTCLIQPMDQGVIECFKRYYKRNFLMRLLNESDQEIPDCIKKFNMYDAILLAAESWNLVKNETLNKAWNKIWPENSQNQDDVMEVIDADFTTILEEFPNNEATTTDINEWVNLENVDPAFNELTDAEIISSVREELNHSSDDDDDEVQTLQNIISHKEASELANKLSSYWQHYYGDVQTTIMLCRVQTIASQDHFKKVQQQKITNYMQPK